MPRQARKAPCLQGAHHTTGAEWRDNTDTTGGGRLADSPASSTSRFSWPVISTHSARVSLSTSADSVNRGIG